MQDGHVQPAEQRKQPPLRLQLAVKLQKHARAAALCGGLHGRAPHARQLPEPAQDGRFRSIHGQQHRYVLRRAELSESGIQLDLAVVQNHHVVAQLLDLAQDVRGKQDGVALAQRVNQRADFGDLPGVQPHGGLVQHQHVRVATQGLCHARALSETLAQVPQQAALHGGQARQLHHLVHVGGDGSGCNALERGHKTQVFTHGHLVVQRRLLGQIPQVPLGLAWLHERVVTAQERTAGGGRQVTGQNVDQRGLARTVLSQQAHDAAALHAQAHILQRPHAPVALGYVFNLNQGHMPSCLQDGRKSASPYHTMRRAPGCE